MSITIKISNLFLLKDIALVFQNAQILRHRYLGIFN